MNIYIGCPIWSNKAWVGDFYPKGTKPRQFLGEYSRRLTTVEGNTTFYAIPSQETVAQWAEETPESFRFCLKIPRSISHAGKLVDHLQEAQHFVDWMRPLGPRMGPMFLQLPPHYPPALFDDLRQFLEAWPGAARLAVEVRHLRWFEPPFHENLNQLLRGFGMARVVIDTRPIRVLHGDRILAGSVYERLLQARERKPDVPILPADNTPFTFLRYIGHPQLEVNAPYIEEWTDFLASRSPVETEAYVFCHCPDDSYAPRLAHYFYERLAEKMVLPALPWDRLEADPPPQPRLF